MPNPFITIGGAAVQILATLDSSPYAFVPNTSDNPDGTPNPNGYGWYFYNPAGTLIGFNNLFLPYSFAGVSVVELGNQEGTGAPFNVTGFATLQALSGATPGVGYSFLLYVPYALNAYFGYFDIVGASAACTCTASLNWTPPQGDVTAMLTATPSTLTAGEVTTLTYGTTGAHLAAIDHGVGPISPLAAGSVPAAPDTSETLTLSALGDWLTSVSATANVTVQDATPDDGPDGCVWRPAPAPACTGWKKSGC